MKADSRIKRAAIPKPASGEEEIRQWPMSFSRYVAEKKATSLKIGSAQKKRLRAARATR